jgi:cell division protein FtsQ
MDEPEMMRKIIRIGMWILIAAWFAVVMGFVSGEADKVICTNIEVVFPDTANSRFVTREDIRRMLEESPLELQGYPLSGINTRRLEAVLEKNPYVKNAEVSKDISGRLEAIVSQREPLIRVMPGGRGGFYLDRDGRIMPLSDRYTPLILLATGNIPYPGENGETAGKLEELYHFARAIAEHPFWKDQIVQIYVNEAGEYELIPRVGAHQILLGGMDHWEQKLRNLELLYRQGFSRYGWNTYEKINLKYTNQVICTKR